jgi:hypothetical protein
MTDNERMVIRSGASGHNFTSICRASGGLQIPSPGRFQISKLPLLMKWSSDRKGSIARGDKPEKRPLRL